LKEGGADEMLTLRSKSDSSLIVTVTRELAISSATSILCERDLGAESNFSGGPRKSGTSVILDPRTSGVATALLAFSGGPRKSGSSASSTFFCLVIPLRPPKKSLGSGFEVVKTDSLLSSGISKHFSLKLYHLQFWFVILCHIFEMVMFDRLFGCKLEYFVHYIQFLHFGPGLE